MKDTFDQKSEPTPPLTKPAPALLLQGRNLCVLLALKVKEHGGFL